MELESQTGSSSRRLAFCFCGQIFSVAPNESGRDLPGLAFVFLGEKIVRVLIELAALFATIALAPVVDSQSSVRPRFHASGNLGALVVWKTAAFVRAPWIAGALAAVQRMRAGARRE